MSLSPEPSDQAYSYDDDIVRKFAAATLLWGLAATLIGVLIGVLLLVPKMFDGVDWLGFGRLRPIHTNVALFAFVGNAMFAAVYYSTQRLCKARMWSDVLSRLHFWGWQAIILAGAITLPMGITQGKEFAEWEWPIDVAVAIVWVLFFGVNFFMTLARRRERYLYVSLWFYITTIVVVAVLHILNSLVFPIGWGKSIPVYAGVQDALVQWFYGHNLIAFFMTMPFLGLMYYFLPKAAGRPVYSYKLAIIHFWALVILYVWAGPHHLHYTAMPEWVTSLGMFFGLMLWMPSWGGLVNGLMTLRGAAREIAANPVLKFFMIGLVFYGWVTLEGPLLSIKSVNALAHYTDWTIAHVHAAALGWNGMMTFGMIYWLLPRLFQTKLWSQKAATLHFWLALAGTLLVVVPLYMAGITQGGMLRAMTDNGNLIHLEFAETLPAIAFMWQLRVLGGLLFVAGLVVMTVNFAMTWASRPATYAVPVYHSVIKPKSDDESLVGSSELDTVPVLDAAKKLDVWTRLEWHRVWERRPGKIVGFCLLALGVGAFFELVPVMLIRSNVPRISSVKPYTPLELAGRDIYIAEGCFNCHSQMVRPIVSETERYGEFSQPGEFVFDRPFQWGSRRIGPDLAREGGLRTSKWHWSHLDDPQSETETSVMPSFVHLLNTPLDFDKIAQRVKAAKALGVPYDRELTDTVAMAKRQAEEIAAEIVSEGGPVNRGKLMTFDTQAVALIAYLQRLGKDLTAPPPVPEAKPAADTEEATPESAPSAEAS
ncbi:MAG: cytochrome-c oxidase, cbb3-type subunit II [Rubripirellula sp.]